MAEPLPQDVVDRLRDALGLEDPNPGDPLHVRLVNTLLRMRHQSLGAQLVALRFDFNWELNEAGKVYAKARTDYEHHIDRETVKLRATAGPDGKFPSRAEAEQIARASDTSYTLRLQYLLAEKREQSMRKFLDTLENRVEVWRTEQANERRADSFTARGQDGQA